MTSSSPGTRTTGRLPKGASALDNGGATRAQVIAGLTHMEGGGLIPDTWCYLLKRFPQLTQTFVATELRELEGQGAALAVVARNGPSGTDGNDAAARGLPGLRCPVRYLSARSAAALTSDPTAGDGEIAARVVELGATHLHAHFAGWAGQAARRVAAATGIGYSVTAHATDIYRADVDESLLAALVADARFVVTVTEDNRSHLMRLLAERGRTGRVVVVYNGIDLERLQRTTTARRPALVVAAGRLVEKKGHDVLIEAVRRLDAAGREVSCVIVGEGPLRASLAHQISESGIDHRVELAGGRDHDSVLDLLRAATVFALPSVVAADGDRDALPTVILEAMALGTPVVSTTVSGIPEMVADGVSGLLVPPRDPAATAAALARLLDDAALRNRLADAARARIEERFDATRNVAVLKELFTDYGRTGQPA